MCDLAQIFMKKREEELRAIANVLIVIACVGIAMCCIAPNGVVGLIGAGLIAVGFLGAIVSENMAECISDKHKGVEYSFYQYIRDNGYKPKEFVKDMDLFGIELEEVYLDYKKTAGNSSINTKRQVKQIFNEERGVMYGRDTA